MWQDLGFCSSYMYIFSWMQAGISTRLNQWWSSTPFITSGVTVICGAIYLVCLLIGYDSYAEICFLPSAVASHFQGLINSPFFFVEHKYKFLRNAEISSFWKEETYHLR